MHVHEHLNGSKLGTSNIEERSRKCDLNLQVQSRSASNSITQNNFELDQDNNRTYQRYPPYRPFSWLFSDSPNGRQPDIECVIPVGHRDEESQVEEVNSPMTNVDTAEVVEIPIAHEVIIEGEIATMSTKSFKLYFWDIVQFLVAVIFTSAVITRIIK